jgi:hypothetical protein
MTVPLLLYHQGARLCIIDSTSKYQPLIAKRCTLDEET